MELNKLIVACVAAVVMSSLGIADDVYGMNWNGVKYAGEIKGNIQQGLVPHGNGRCDYDNGTSYDGGWANGKWHGVGTLKLDGLNIAGDFANGRLSYGKVVVRTILLMGTLGWGEFEGEYAEGIIRAKNATGHCFEYKTDNVKDGTIVIKDATGEVHIRAGQVDGVLTIAPEYLTR
ncbi:hypothetical protein FACS189449_01130 [Alphaproteobacteria bacterium]|nr:hypothetical protein FACS189449_01130 [Alphaproteobacteria bacterium]